MNRTYLSALILVLFTSYTACASDSTKVEIKALNPEPQHQMVYGTVMQLIASYHYQKPKIDDVFSSKGLDNYLKHIDPNRVYFFQSDISNFEKYRYQLDESILNGDLKAAYEIFNTYQERLKDRIEFAKKFLSDSLNFDFTKQDSFQIKREDAPYANSIEELNKLWELKLKYECISMKSNGKSFADYGETIKKRYINLERFAAKTKSEDVFQLYVNSLADLADPHTNYFSPKASADFATQMSLSLEGIGATLQSDFEYTKIVSVTKGSPAERSKKVHPGDKIIGVAQGDSPIVNIVDWRLDDVVSLIRGKKGTTVRLEIIPASEPNKTKIVSIIRDKIIIEEQSAKSSIKTIKRNGKNHKFGVITIPSFYIDFAAARKNDPNYKSTTRDVKKLIAELNKQKVEGLIIDLRNNGGGSLQEAVELTGLFIKTGPVVQVKDGAGVIKNEDDNNPEVYYDGPLVVLVNRFSASASEILSAAIQDYGRGVVIGEKTFGKGTVQNMVALNEFIRMNDKPMGDLKLTIAKFYRVTGSSTQHRGVIPDIEFPSIYAAKQFGEDASEFALPWDQIDATHYEAVNRVGNKMQLIKTKHDERMKDNHEYGFLLQDIDFFKAIDKKKFQNLNIEVYKSENDKIDADKKAREADRKLRKVSATPDLIMDETLEIITDLL
ncbi:MAG: carboxy terminal-processing peptidase [Bacteroidia bacterium]|nr:carboxy terminal-processing peptidase [Bacteroidia bacterium]